MAKHYNWKIGEPLPVLGAHSLAKHNVFASYTGQYIRILSSIPQKRELNLTLVDGFSGGGTYLFKNEVVPGSPLLLLRAVQAAEAELAATRRRGFRVKSDFYFVDRNPHHSAFLREELAKSPFRDEIDHSIRIWTGDFEARVAEIIEAIRAKGPSHRALFFLDQYGWSAVSFAVIRRIFTDLANPEVLITFSVDTLIDYLTDQTAKMRSGQAIELDPALGEALAELRTEHRQRQVIQGFLYRHVLERTGADFYTPFFIHSPESHRSYWLLHLSRHARARDEMARLHWSMSNTFVHPGRSGFNALGYDPSLDEDQLRLEFDFGSNARTDSLNSAVEQLPRMIRDDSAGDGDPISLRSLFEANCNETPLTLELVSDAIVQLRDEFEEVEVFDAEGKLRPRATHLSGRDLVRARNQRSFLKSFGRR
jgi:three-Cys-motif partner protein